MAFLFDRRTIFDLNYFSGDYETVAKDQQEVKIKHHRDDPFLWICVVPFELTQLLFYFK